MAGIIDPLKKLGGRNQGIRETISFRNLESWLRAPPENSSASQDIKRQEEGRALGICVKSQKM